MSNVRTPLSITELSDALWVQYLDDLIFRPHEADQLRQVNGRLLKAVCDGLLTASRGHDGKIYYQRPPDQA